MIPDWASDARAKWRYVGAARPSSAESPGEGQECSPTICLPPDDVERTRLAPSRGAGVFFGGWITPEIVGPFKDGPGTEEW